MAFARLRLAARDLRRLASPLALLAILCATGAVYAQVVQFGFVTWDDPLYVTSNAEVQRGLSLANAAWALSARVDSNWLPLTWLSHMLDVQLFGLDPRSVERADAERVLGQALEREATLADLLRRPGVSYAKLMTLPGAGVAAADAAIADQVETATKYAGYIDRQRDEIARAAAQEGHALPGNLDYRTVRGLSVEVQQKLNQHRPETLGQAGRISGITPAAISLLLVHLKRGFQPQKKSA